MLSTILKLLTTTGIKKHWQSTVIAALLALVAYQNISNTRWFVWADTIPYLKERVIVQDYELQLVEQSNNALKISINHRNDQIEQLGNLSRQAEQTSDFLQEEIEDIKTRTNRQIQLFSREDIPHECAAAMENLNDSAPFFQFNNVLDSDLLP